MQMSKITAEGDEVVENNSLFTYIHSGFHDGPISVMDICMHRPIIATLSRSEKAIRIWNYKKPNC